jgi:hypothetical protein
MVLKHGSFVQQIRNTWKVLKCDAGEGWRSSVGPIMCEIKKYYLESRGPVSLVSIATDYGLDGPGIESRWVGDFSHTSRPVLGPTQPPVQWVKGLSRE